MLDTIRKYFRGAAQKVEESPKVKKREGEISKEEYLSSLLSPVDRDNVEYLRDSIHQALLEKDIKSALIAVGSVVTGVASGEDYYNSAGPDDIDLKVIVADQEQGNEFYGVFLEWGEKLNGRFVEVDGHPTVIRYTHIHMTDEESINFHYDGGYIITPKEGKTIDLIVKGVRFLPAGKHIEEERNRNHAFSVLYKD
ncbi:hypothetical protein GOV06_00210 [Candidatus Woesearchaeota archaeon]|nr:hypothetical protein [Candidatus Woesearchaeota archaeon]